MKYQVDVHAKDNVYRRYHIEADNPDIARAAAMDAVYDEGKIDYINPLDVVAVPL